MKVIARDSLMNEIVKEINKIKESGGSVDRIVLTELELREITGGRSVVANGGRLEIGKESYLFTIED